MSNIQIKVVSSDSAEWEVVKAIEIAVFGNNKSAQFLASMHEEKLKKCALLAYNNKTPIGFLTCYMQNNTAWILNLGVLSVYRRKGVGKALLNHLETLCRNKNATEIRLNVEKTNLPAIAFYKTLGYEILNETLESEADENFILMVKVISD